MKFLSGVSFLLLCIMGGGCLFAQEAAGTFKKTSFYSAMAGNSENALNEQLDLLKTVSISEKNAYEAALLMKKAGIAGGARKKLNLFKEGQKKMETALQKDSANVEFRFLRLMIQEHAPGILGYKGELEKDKLYIKNNFKKMPPAAQEAALIYSKDSKILKLADL
jgi:hypothetical protein